jgi:hypothetical protein
MSCKFITGPKLFYALIDGMGMSFGLFPAHARSHAYPALHPAGWHYDQGGS